MITSVIGILLFLHIEIYRYIDYSVNKKIWQMKERFKVRPRGSSPFDSV